MGKFRITILFFVWISTCFLYGKSSPREMSLINSSWKYAQGDFIDAEKVAFDDKAWENVGLPHSFSIPYFMSKDFYVGYGWYRKMLHFDSVDLEKKLFLEFDGVFQEAEIFVNGELAGSHVGGYTGFSIDISQFAKEGENLIAVRVNNIWRPDVAPRAGEHVFSGGIYRNVYLVKKEHSYITWYGTYITTPDLENKEGKSSRVKIETEVCNASGKTSLYHLKTVILDNEGKKVSIIETKDTVASGEKRQLVQFTNSIAKPTLWSPQNPCLYTAVSSLYQNGELVDFVKTSFGFRWFKWTADRGFFLNGEHFNIKGVNVHQDQAGWGDAVTESAMRRDVDMVKEAGFNLIRGSHYPHAPIFSQACDEAGILFWSEAPFWGIGGFKVDGYWDSSAYPVNKEHEQAFEESALKQLQEMIRIHRNHPSIIAWSMCNEAFFSAPEAMPGVRRLLKRMVDLTHRLDATRPAAVGGAQRPLGNERIDLIGDIAGYNGDGATQPDFQNPGIPNIVSEYGSVTSERPGEYAPGWGDLQRNDGWKGHSWRSGQAIWCGFDHGSIAGSALGKMGIVDYFRIPKRSWYWYRNEYTGVAHPEWAVEGQPYLLKLEASKYKGVKTDGTDDVYLKVIVCDKSGKHVSSTPNVNLKVISGPGEFPTGRSICFEKDSDIRIMDGVAAISFRSYYAGKTVVEASSDGLEKALIELEFDGPDKFYEGVTPVTECRPYVRFVKKQNGDNIQTFGINNPVFASSNEQGHTPGMAADGNTNTYWKAADGDKSPYWMLDTEKNLFLRDLQVNFISPFCGSFVIEVSDNKKDWTLLYKQENKETGRQLLLSFDDIAHTGRFVRICFNKASEASFSEIKVKGVVRE